MGITISQKEISLDLQNQGFTNTIYSQEGDSNSRQLTVSLFDDGEKYIIESSSNVYLEGVRADNATVHRKVDSFKDNVVKILFKSEELCVKGVAKYKIVIYGSNGDILSSVPFRVKVYENVYDENGIIASPVYTELQETLNKAKELETTISTNETVRENNENIRKENESERVSNEKNRKDAESSRASTEEQRVLSEETRISNEDTRKSNESERVNSESKRVSAENTRSESELTRNSNENKRILNEDNRKTAEELRSQSESQRVSSETVRTANEESRDTAENNRKTAEETRVNNENTRKESEQLRETNENSRVNAEKTRIVEFDDIKNKFETISSEAENINVEAISSDDEIYQVKITNKSGESTTSPNLLNKIEIGNVETEMYNQEASATITGNFGEQKLNLKLPIGKPFKIKKSYKSIAEMDATITTDLELGEFCIINTGDVEDEDNAKLYIRDENGASFLTDLSGAQGIQGIKGDVGETPNLTIGTVDTGEEGSKASATITGTKENPVINFVIPRGEKGSVENISASSIPYDSSSSDTVKDVVDKIQNDYTNHNHDDRYYTETETDAKFNEKVDLSAEGVSKVLNKLSTETIIPTDNDYFVSQYTGDDSTKTTYHRKPMSALWSYIKSKADSIYAAINHEHTKADITDFPTSMPANGGDSDTVNGHTVESDVPENAKFTDTIYTHPTSSGNKHIPSGGSSGQILRWSTDGTAVWKDITLADSMTYNEDTGELCLKSDSKVLSTVTVKGGGGSGTYVGDEAPKDTSLLWIDTGNGGIAKYYNGSSWIPTASVWG